MGVNFLNTISNILEDFFHCLKLPIKAIDSNYNLIYNFYKSLFLKFTILGYNKVGNNF